jgi:hypothetical protein
MPFIRKDTSFEVKPTVHSAEQPSERERDRCSRIGLFFDGVAQRPLKGTGGLGGAVDGLVIEIFLGGIRHFTGPVSWHPE